MFTPQKFTVSQAKPLPVFLLIDTSGSMQEIIDSTGMVYTGQKTFVDGKEYQVVTGGISRMMVLNDCVSKMIRTFQEESQVSTQIQLGVITFGKSVELHQPLQNAVGIQWQNLEGDGDTPLGEALRLMKNIIEDKNIVPGRAYRPVVILISDGKPDAGWEIPLAQFLDGRSSKCDRMALGIGPDADFQMLERFIAGTENEVFEAKDAEKIKDFFKMATMSVTVRSRSVNPNDLPCLAAVKHAVEEKESAQKNEVADENDYSNWF